MSILPPKHKQKVCFSKGDPGLGNQLAEWSLTFGDFFEGAVPLVVAARVQLHLMLITTHTLAIQDTHFYQEPHDRLFSKWQLSKLIRHNSGKREWTKFGKHTLYTYADEGIGHARTIRTHARFFHLPKGEQRKLRRKD
jgi:hypothetical protein